MTKSTIKQPRPFCNLIGNRYGRWTVIDEAGHNKIGQILWLCKCDCGVGRAVVGWSLKGGKSKGCGCKKNLYPHDFILDQHVLKEHLNYDSDTGFLDWISPSGNGDSKSLAGCEHHTGYIYIRLGGSIYPAHRLAWLYMTGKWPENQIDHINGIKNDNRFCNLREATMSNNMMNRGIFKNNTSGFKGVSYKGKKWRARCTVNKKQYNLGIFSTK